ncbi:MAG TPA: hypothetical protein V6C97_23805 [Oculatellaceae cyanobacterium]
MYETIDIGLLTSASYADLQSDYWLIRDELIHRGYNVKPVIWNDEKVDWSKIRNVVMCSAWDYHRNFNQFINWLTEREQDCNVINTPSLAKWNLDKTYLHHFEKHAIPVIPTIWFEKNSSLPQDFSCEWQDVVMKPTVGAGSIGMKRFNTTEGNELIQEHFRALSQKSGIMLQPYLSSAGKRGEVALIYFNGQFSHSIGRPLTGHEVSSDEEVAQTFHREPSDAQLEIRERVLKCLPSLSAYVRIDFLPDNEGQDRILEIEMVEPSLFFKADAASPSRFADALEERWIK